MQTVVLKNGKEAKLLIDSRSQTATVITQDGESHLVMFVRANQKVVIKNDLLLNSIDTKIVKDELSKFIKKEDNSKNKKGRK